ncbi:MAG TPA: LacI family DNA-binding transcriptional regulator [Sphaerochaeta sp.]|nr:LacI family DNA-binding transcriptional regulator [Sphaerochaeta sp.]
MANIKEVAKLAGVSVSTVSRVFNQQSYVKAETRARILEAIEKTGYVPNRAAREMVAKHATTVGIVMPETFNNFQRQIFSIVARQLEEHSYHTGFYYASTEAEDELKCLNRIKADRLNGIIILHELTQPGFNEYLTVQNIPTVLATFRAPSWNAPAIHISEEEAAAVAVRHLITNGHRNIAVIAGRQFTFSTRRLAGYGNALALANIALDERNIVYSETYSMQSGYEAARHLSERSNTFTAVFAITDELAIGAIRYFQDRGLKIPEDLSVVGFDNIELASFVSPRLTTIAQPIEEMGNLAVELLHSMITDKEKSRTDILLPFTLIERESTAQLR